MGTNYYAKVIPTLSLEQKDKYKKAIDEVDFKTLKFLQLDLDYPPNYPAEFREFGDSLIHLGKNTSKGFKWNPQCYVRWNKDVVKLYKHFTKEAIKDLIFRKDILILDEYDDVIDKNEFYGKFIKGEIKETNPFSLNYTKRTYNSSLIDYLRSLKDIKMNNSNTEFYSDGLIWSTCTEFC